MTPIKIEGKKFKILQDGAFALVSYDGHPIGRVIKRSTHAWRADHARSLDFDSLEGAALFLYAVNYAGNQNSIRRARLKGKGRGLNSLD